MANLTFLYQMFDIHSLKAQSHINLEEEFQFLLQGLKRKAFFFLFLEFTLVLVGPPGLSTMYQRLVKNKMS